MMILLPNGYTTSPHPAPCQRLKEYGKCGKAARIIPPDKILTCVFCYRDLQDGIRIKRKKESKHAPPLPIQEEPIQEEVTMQDVLAQINKITTKKTRRWKRS